MEDKVQDEKANPELERALLENKLMRILMAHIGANRVIGMGELYEALYGETWTHRINDTRPLREIITDMRESGIPICSIVAKPGGGYYLAATASELDEYAKRIESAALKKLKQASQLRRVALPELLGQIAMNLASYDVAGEGMEGEE